MGIAAITVGMPGGCRRFFQACRHAQQWLHLQLLFQRQEPAFRACDPADPGQEPRLAPDPSAQR
jgi:hypothetical protein